MLPERKGWGEVGRRQSKWRGTREREKGSVCPVERTDYAEDPEKQSPASKKARGPETVRWEGRKWL